jgi:hypothetical protein
MNMMIKEMPEKSYQPALAMAQLEVANKKAT